MRGRLLLIFLLALGGVAVTGAVLPNLYLFGQCMAGGICEEGEVYPTIRGSRVLMTRGASKTFYVDGSVILENNTIGYCLDYSPEERFTLEVRNGGRVNTLTTVSNERELITVLSLPREQCG